MHIREHTKVDCTDTFLCKDVLKTSAKEGTKREKKKGELKYKALS